MSVWDMAKAGDVPGAATVEGAETRSPRTIWKRKVAAYLLFSMVMDLHRSPSGYFAPLFGGKSAVEILRSTSETHHERSQEAQAQDPPE